MFLIKWETLAQRELEYARRSLTRNKELLLNSGRREYRLNLGLK